MTGQELLDKLQSLPDGQLELEVQIEGCCGSCFGDATGVDVFEEGIYITSR